MFIREYIEDVACDLYIRRFAPIIKRIAEELLEISDGMHPDIRVALDDGAKLPVRAHSTDAGADLCCIGGFTVQPHDSILVDTGVHVELPPHTVGMLKSKSGLNCLQAIRTTGVIDEGYTGSIKVRVYNDGDYPKTFNAGDKVTQLVIVPAIYPTYEEADSIEGGDRGDAGFGSTGN